MIMKLTSALSIANQGIQNNLQQFTNAVDKISDPEGNAGIKEIVEMKQAEQGIKVNAAVIRTANEMTGSLINILA